MSIREKIVTKVVKSGCSNIISLKIIVFQFLAKPHIQTQLPSIINLAQPTREEFNLHGD